MLRNPNTAITNPAILKAMQSVEAASAQAARDPLRPVYHFRPPANWMNDPNGTIYHDGYVHLFYQHNPYGDTWGHMHWGHARTRDLVQWEHLPIALWPSEELGEEHCFSGCAAVNAEGTPMLLYTRVGAGDGEQWAALGDARWETWQKYGGNPVLQIGGQGAPAFGGAWRDPYLFRAAGRTFLVVGANLEQTAGIALYEAEDDTLLRWRYHKLLYEKPVTEIAFFECPNFIPMGNDRWLLLSSPYTPVQYVAGHFAPDTLTFTPDSTGVIDPGASDGFPAHYYATNTAFVPGENEPLRCILFGWIRGFAPGMGWNGCLALPRELTLDADGTPRQRPIPELTALRDQQSVYPDQTLADGVASLSPTSNTVEIQLTVQASPGARAGISLFGPPSAANRATTIAYDGHTLWVAGQPVACAAEPTGLTLRVFVDRSTLELFVDDGRLVMTRVIAPPQSPDSPPDSPPATLMPTLFAEDGRADFRAVATWELSPIW